MKISYFLRKIIASLAIFTLASGFVAPNALAIEEFEPKAAAAIIMDADSGDVLYALNENEIRAPASTTKLLTALITVEAIEAGEIGLTDTVVATENANFDLTWDSSTQNIQEGEILTVEQLLYCALVASANESCNILAEYVSGSIEAFIVRMNARLQELGCNNSHFGNTHGLPLEEHYTTAYDLALIGRAALTHPLIVKIANTVNYTIPATNMSKERKLLTTNYLLHTETPHYYYEYAQGLKTGSTDAAGHCLVSSATKNGMQVVGVILGASAIQIESGQFRTESFTESKRMYEWFFENFEYRDVLKSSELIDSVPVKLGKSASEVIVHPETGLRKIMPKDADISSVTSRQITLDVPDDGIVAPIARGEKLGEISIIYNGKRYGPFPLVANSRIELDRAAYLLTRVKATLNQTWIKVTFVVVIVLAILYFYIAFRRRQLNRRKRKELARKRQERVVYYDDDENE